MFLLRLAYARRKVLIIIWSSPHPVDKFLLPNKIDWTTTGLPVRVVRSIHSRKTSPYNYRKQDQRELKKMAANPHHAANFSHEPVIHMQVRGAQVLVGPAACAVLCLHAMFA
jgi:hypothetical protein